MKKSENGSKEHKKNYMHQKMLERLEDKEDLTDLVKMRKDKLRFRKFDDFLAEDNNAL